MHGKWENLEPVQRLPYSSSDCIVLNNCHIYLAQFFLLDCSLSVVGLPCDKQNFLYLLEYQINKQQITLVLTYLMSHPPGTLDSICISQLLGVNSSIPIS